MTDDSPVTTDQVAEALGIGRHGAGRSRRAWRWSWLLILPALLALLVFGWVYWQRPPAPEWRTAAVEQGPLTVTVTATGDLQPVNQVEVGTEVSGTVASVEADYNQQVKAGQVLARLDTEQLTARLRQSEAAASLALAEVAQARATLADADAKLRRAGEMHKNGYLSQDELDSARAARDRAKAGLDIASAQVDQARAQRDSDRSALQKAVIRAPISGIVLERKVEPGQTVAAALQTPVLFVLAESLAQMELHVAVDEADVGQVKEGQQATFTVDAFPGRTFPAAITQLRYAPQTVEGVVSYEAVLSVDNRSLLLRPGMTATAQIRVDHVDNALQVPNAALRFTPVSGGPDGAVAAMSGSPAQEAPAPRVWILKDGEPEAVPVETEQTDGRMTVVKSDRLKPGMQVLVDQVTARSS